ncbi:MAG: hypothetical protein ACRCX5_05330 [Bacteroidales bacterium]
MKEKLKQLFCIHKWVFVKENYEIFANIGGLVFYDKCDSLYKCSKCGKEKNKIIMKTKRTKEHKLLNKFLRENKCKRKYYRNRKNWPYPLKPKYFIISAFIFCGTLEGEEYWLNIQEKWETYVNNNNL